MDEEKINHKINSLQNDLTIIKLTLNKILKELSEIKKNGKHNNIKSGP